MTAEPSLLTRLSRFGRHGTDARGESTTGRATRWLWVAFAASLALGVGAWALGKGFLAAWLFMAAAAAIGLVLPPAYALVSPLFMGLFGWLVDLFPLVILAGWTTVVLRWLASLWRERRLPSGGRWVWIPIVLLAWTTLGIIPVVVAGGGELKHFMLLFGLQFLISATVLAVVDWLHSAEQWTKIVSGMVLYVVILAASVLLQHVGVPVESLQDDTVGDRVEEAYGLDAFRNEIGMIKWARARNGGVGETRRALRGLRADHPGLPAASVFLPKFRAFRPHIVVRFDGSARPYAAELAEELDMDLMYDSVGLAPANLVPRWRSFARNALTFSGLCAAFFPLALFLAWTQKGRTRWLGRIGAAACLAGAGFAIARGAWVAILIGIAYLVIDGLVSGRRKLQMVLVYVVAAVLLTVTFIGLYGDDPLRARAGAEGSVVTREELYSETIEAVGNSPVYLFTGYGTEQPRTESGSTRAAGELGRYVPRAGTHSTYLNYLFRAGIVGALGIALLYLLSALHGRAAAREWSGDARIFATLTTASVVLISAHAVILSLYVEPAYSLGITLVIGLGLVGVGRLSRSILPWRTGA
ncbi:MAG: O-antigen ligase family protein [Actinomycetota bacterium]